MQAALFLREKQELRKKKQKIRRRRYELPTHVATREIAPFPQFPPNSWGKAAWQEREFGLEAERKESICLPSEVHCSSKVRQKEAHRRWVRKNRITDLSLGDQNSDEDDLLLGVQNGAANLLLYVGLGTMCVGMIIAFVGTGEKGFKTMELRLIGPSLICSGILIIILRVLLCFCPTKCLRRLKRRKQKLKNSSNKLNSEGENRENQILSAFENGEQEEEEEEEVEEEERGEEEREEKKKNVVEADKQKKMVSIAPIPTLCASGENVRNSSSPSSSSSSHHHLQLPAVPETISFVENEKSIGSESWKKKWKKKRSAGEEPEVGENPNSEIELKELTGNDLDVAGTRRTPREIVDFGGNFGGSPTTSGPVDSPPETKFPAEKTWIERFLPNSSRRWGIRNIRSSFFGEELVLSPSALDESKETAD